jgi:hypothetical protein
LIPLTGGWFAVEGYEILRIRLRRHPRAAGQLAKLDVAFRPGPIRECLITAVHSPGERDAPARLRYFVEELAQ